MILLLVIGITACTHMLPIDKSWNVLGYLAQQTSIDWDGKDRFGNNLMDCLQLHTNKGTMKEVILLCQEKCNALYQDWVKYHNE